ncbi:olfactory receptor 51I2-like [Elephas maximus indicus]|uniref:olfactory receptor 51I2-like n=1 Tax=Elephas maximus indicus TaxID=99487 RepID=UPI002116876E|nr:olfactory receptor 51I2-like [Elephas maximus indicus]
MGAKGNASVDLLPFFLTGIPGLEAQHGWLSIPFFTMYIIAIVGNSLIMAAVQADPALHEPMYLFLSMLAITEVGVSVSTLPTVMDILWFDARQIDFDGCLAQMFFIHTFSCMESGVRLAMSYDRFVAILNLPRIISMGFGITLKSVALIAPLPILSRQLPYCHTNVLSHSYCLHSDLIQMPCADTKLNSILGLAIVLTTFGLDSLLVVVFYVLILYTVLGIASGEGRRKALNTCVSHICAVLVYYVPMIGVSVMHHAAKHASPMVHTLTSSIYLFVPPVINPIIYSVKTWPIRKGIVAMFSHKRELL